MANDGSVQLGIRRRIEVGRGGTRVGLSVFCPRVWRSTHVEVCRRCPRAVAVGDAAVTCLPAVDPTRSETFVGAALGDTSLGVDSDTPVVDLARQVGSAGWIAVVVLDPDQGAIGLIDHEQLARAERGVCAGALVRPVAPVLESSPLMSVVLRMVRERARALPVVDAALRTVGIVTDLDALRWVSAHGKRD